MWIAIVPAIVRTEPEPTPNVCDRLERLLPQPRMRRQTEIVVRREIDDRLVVERGVRLLLVVEDAQPAVEVLLLERVELVAQVGERIADASGEYIRGRDFGGESGRLERLRHALELRAGLGSSVSRDAIHSVNSTCRIAAVGTARMAPGMPSSLPPISSATMTATALTPTCRSMTFGTSTWFSSCCCTTKNRSRQQDLLDRHRGGHAIAGIAARIGPTTGIISPIAEISAST